MAKPEDSKKKGTFGVARLPVALKYTLLDNRRTMMIIGGGACLALLLYFLADLFLLKSNFTASGPLSTYHATFEKDCKKCHDTKSREVRNDKCSVCHEQAGAKAERDSVALAAAQLVYTFDSHYLYRSMDLARVEPKRQEYGERETRCYACHPEHLGRQARITSVSDNRCTECHKYGSFNKDHPEFDVIAGIMPDDSPLTAPDDTTLKFTHISHITKYVPKIRKEGDVERICLYCHNPKPDGKSFMPLEFDNHCSGSSCHITEATPDLTISNSAGVQTLETIRRLRGAGTQWATYMNPRVFQISDDGATVSKQKIEHEDPWVTENLKRLRRQLYPDLEFADLLKGSGRLISQTDQVLTATVYQEALQSLQSYADDLRSRLEPEIQDDLDRVEAQIKQAQRMFRDQMNSGAGPQFVPEPAPRNPNSEIETTVSDLTSACQKCHVVAGASIQRVAKDQRVLTRAEFDHRAHILDRRCLECHTDIPILRAPGDTTKVNNRAFGAAIQNVPGIENCRDCHNASQSSNRCVTCHYFHPNKTNRASLSLYLD